MKHNTELVDALFNIVKQTNPSIDVNQVNKLQEKAQNDVSSYHTDMKGIKGLYAKLHQGWLFQLFLFFATDIVSTYIIKWKHNVMSSQTQKQDFDDFDDLDDLENL